MYGHDNNGVLAALHLVNSQGIGQVQFGESAIWIPHIPVRVGYLKSLLFGVSDIGNKTYLAIKYFQLIVVFNMGHLITQPKLFIFKFDTCFCLILLLEFEIDVIGSEQTKVDRGENLNAS